MKWLMILFTLFSRHFFSSNGEEGHINPVTELKDYIRENAVKVLMAFVLATTMSSLFVAGLVISVVHVSMLYDQNQPILLTATLTSGIAMSITSLLVMAIVYKSMTSETKKRVVKTQVSTPHPTALQESLLILVNDFVKEREFNRSQKSQAENQSPARSDQSSTQSDFSHYDNEDVRADKH